MEGKLHGKNQDLPETPTSVESGEGRLESDSFESVLFFVVV